MTWKDRIKDWRDVLCSVTNAEVDQFSETQWCDWCSAWDNYVKNGGQRPPNRPPI